MMSQVRFTIDPNKEFEYHKLFLEVDDWNDISYFESIENNNDAIEKIKGGIDEGLFDYIEKMQMEWDKINDEYFEKLSTITELKPFHREYEVLVASKMMNYDFGGFAYPCDTDCNRIIIAPLILEGLNYIVAHEIFHLFFYYYYHHKLNLDLSPHQFTLLTESTAELGMIFTDMKDLFGFTEKDVKNWKSPYSVVQDHWNELLEIWNSRRSFEDYILRVSKEVKI